MSGSLLILAEGGVLDVNIWTIVWAWVIFGVTLWALSKIAWPMLAAKMEEREIRIREGLEKAEEAEKRAEELLARQESVLDEAREEAKKILAESRSSAEHMKGEAVEAAQREIADERERAKKEIVLERAKAVDEIKRAAVDLTLEAASRVLERELNDEDHRRLAAEVIEKVDILR